MVLRAIVVVLALSLRSDAVCRRCARASATEYGLMALFKPKLQTLPKAQRTLWPSLAPITRQGFVLRNQGFLVVVGRLKVPMVAPDCNRFATALF
jgi:hypothetical protein